MDSEDFMEAVGTSGRAALRGRSSQSRTPEDAALRAELQLHLRKGQGAGAECDLAFCCPLQSGTDEPLAALYEKQALRAVALDVPEHFTDAASVRSYDASWHELGIREGVLVADLGVEKGRGLGGKKRINPMRLSWNEQLSERSDGGWSGISVDIAKPGDPSGLVVSCRVEKRSPRHGKLGLEARYVIEMEPENGEPVGKTVPGDVAQRDDLFDPRTIAGKAEVVIEIVGHQVMRQPRKTQAYFARDLGKRETAGREDPFDPVGDAAALGAVREEWGRDNRLPFTSGILFLPGAERRAGSLRVEVPGNGLRSGGKDCVGRDTGQTGEGQRGGRIK